MTFQNGERVELVEISQGKQIVGGFEVGQKGVVVGEVAENYPVVKWDKPIIPTNDTDIKITQTDCSSKTLRKI